MKQLFKSPNVVIAFAIAFLLLMTNQSHAQFDMKTFGNFIKVKGGDPDKPTDFKSSFPLKAQIYVLVSFPSQPSDFTVECYKVDGSKEKLTDAIDVKWFKKEPNKTASQYKAIGSMIEPGEYKAKLVNQKDKSIVSEVKFTVTSDPAKPARTVAELFFSDDTDDNFNPIKPTKSIKKGDGVNFSAKLKEAIGAKFFIWAVFEIKSETEEVLFKDLQQNVDNETYRWFATTDKTYFTKPGKYAVYMLPQNATNSGMTVNKPTTFYARGVLEVK